MKDSFVRNCLGIGVLLVVGVLGAKAQSSEAPCSPGAIGTGGAGPTGRIAYSATAKTTFEQHLQDGNTIHGFMRTHMARDGAGRTMFEMGQACVRDENGMLNAQLYVNIFDPATKTTMAWNVGNPAMSNIVRVSHVSGTPRKQLTPEELAARHKALQQRWHVPQSEFKTDDLGTKTIAGVEAHGSRITRTIPPGEEGNELPLVTTTENWRSEKLGITLSIITDDPRRGKTIFEIEELVQGEPNPAVFAVPEGYKVEDVNPVQTASSTQ
jgi:hypothetical protein